MQMNTSFDRVYIHVLLEYIYFNQGTVARNQYIIVW
jgi:hypothetical protein